MKEYKNIDRLFQENFKDLEIAPSDRVWSNIESRLSGRSAASVVPIFRKLSGIAVAFLLFFSLGLGYFKPWKKEAILQKDTQNNSLPSINTQINGSESEFTEGELMTSVEVKNKIENTKSKNSTSKLIPVAQERVVAVQENIAFEKLNSENSVALQTPENMDNEELKSDINQITSNREFLESNRSKELTMKEKIRNNDKKWSVGPTIAPVYLNSLQSGSPISENLAKNPIRSDEALSYGVKINYQLTEKIKIQSGINKLELGYNTKDVNLAISSSKFANHNLKSVTPGIYLTSTYGSKNDIEASVAGKSAADGELNQSFEYVEIPVEMKYNLFQSKVGLNVVGGFSTLILTNNQVSFVLPQNFTTNIGEANNLNSLNFSGNLGFDIDYKISSDWFLNVTPMVKYQFNTFSGNSGNFQPYFFGVYSGVNYRF